ncbi:MAG TPA: GDSL family lipase [Cytophagales bacterium]|nr:GDSL family lipase [Cytophagales bacterium]HAA17793.1 GDSL family lipase [Cytophagales bacterium]HAP59979.1 GDSL family lipase [Cytophagales bacterium]
MNGIQEPPEIWTDEIGALRIRVELLKDQEELVVFYGSSSLRLWDSLGQDMAPLNVLNLAFGGSTYAWCSYFFEEVFAGVHPRRVVLYNGDNDLGHGLSPDEVLSDYQELVGKIQKHTPEAQIIVIGVKPSPSKDHQLDELEEVNRGIVRHLESIGGQYIDVYGPMLDAVGNTRPELFEADMLHMNEQGYDIWRHVIRNELMSE